MPHTIDTRGLGGRVAIVTSAARGIGRATYVELAHAGRSVVAVDVGEPSDTVAAVTASGARGHAILADEPALVRA